MKRLSAVLVVWLFSAALALAQNTGGNPLVPNGASGGGGGGGSVNNLATLCPNATLSPSGGTITLPNGFGEIPESTSFTPTAAQCGAIFTSTGGAGATLPALVSVVNSPYGITIKNADTAGTSMTIGGGGSNINYNGSLLSSITLAAGQSTLLFVNAANTAWQATSNSTSTTPVWQPGYISGQWYSISNSPFVATGATQVASSVYCTLENVQITVKIKSLGTYFTTGVASGNVAYALFNASNGRPSTLIDYAGPVAEPTSAGASTASLHNVTDTLAPGVYFGCETQDNATGVMNSVYNGAGATGATWIGLGAPVAPVNTTGVGISCAAATACGAGYAAWSGTSFTWANFASPTWTTNESTKTPLIYVQAN